MRFALTQHADSTPGTTLDNSPSDFSHRPVTGRLNGLGVESHLHFLLADSGGSDLKDRGPQSPPLDVRSGPREGYQPLPVGDTTQGTVPRGSIRRPCQRGHRQLRALAETRLTETWQRDGRFHIRVESVVKEDVATASHKPAPIRKGAGRGARGRKPFHSPRL